ncbi:MAG: UvrD-helicase domain-containing protein, partial [Calditrichaeota bacterium]|nr:UvrD-helicase domain-containing protein [Calditrichota bacterium]
MTSLPKDHVEREKVRANLIDASLVVEAGAGTGKTSLLIDRLFTLLQKFNITDLAAITFTEKAAAELSDRMRSRLEIELLKGEKKPDTRLLRALNDIDHAQISTIHSFALSIIRERPFETGIDPDFEHIEEEEEHALLEQLLSKDLSFTNYERDSLLSKFILLGGRFNRVKELLQIIHKERELLPFFSLVNDAEDVTIWLNRLRVETYRLASIAREHCAAEDSGRMQIDRLSIAAPINTDEEAWRWLFELCNLDSRSGLKKNWDDGDLSKAQKEAVKALKADAQQVLDEARTEVLNELIIYLRRIVDKTERAKSELGVLGFHDYLALANNLLTNPQALEYFHNRYKRLLIDEFQDTDPLQVEIALRFAAAKTVIDDVYNVPLEQGRLCVIGDPKQSIYRFRRADPRIYLHTTDLIEKQGSKVQISQNFRSAPGIINFVNDFFSPIWEEVSVDGTDYAPIFPVEGRPDPDPSPPVIIIQQSDNTEQTPQNISDARQIEADTITRIIHSMVSIEKWQCIQQADDGYETSAVNYGDIAILLPKFTGIEFYSGKLEEAGIPYNIESGKGFYTRQIVRDVHNCLSTIDNPANRLALIGALRSSFFGLSDDVLAVWMKQSSGVLDYRLKFDDLPQVISDALETLFGLHKDRKELSPDHLIEALIELTDIIPVLLSDPNTRRDVKVLENLVDLARNQSLSDKLSLRNFLRWFSERLTADEKQETAPAADRVDYVRLMTVHSAKGLEFPVVILPGVNWSDSKTKRKKCIVDRLGKRFEIEIGSSRDGFRTAGYNEALEADKFCDQSERLRLLYVAMTRARDHLVLPCIHVKKPAGYTAWLSDIINRADVYTDFPTDRIRVISGDSLPQITHAHEETDEFKFNSQDLWETKKCWLSDRHQRLEK